MFGGAHALCLQYSFTHGTWKQIGHNRVRARRSGNQISVALLDGTVVEKEDHDHHDKCDCHNYRKYFGRVGIIQILKLSAWVNSL